nr:hypothetical protein CFP56_00783 [Quercus suber]
MYLHRALNIALTHSSTVYLQTRRHGTASCRSERAGHVWLPSQDCWVTKSTVTPQALRKSANRMPAASWDQLACTGHRYSTSRSDGGSRVVLGDGPPADVRRVRPGVV